jgi:iron complex transport system ATP-binding protein
MMGRFSHRGWVSAYTPEDLRAVDEALAAAGLEEFSERSLDCLSGGEVQRVMIARAIAQKPSVILLDEPVSHLDIKYQVSVLELVRRLAREGMAVGVSLHDLNLASLYADRIGLLSGGVLSAIGDPANILSKENIDAAYDTEVFVREHPLHPRPQVIYIPSWMKQEKD